MKCSARAAASVGICAIALVGAGMPAAAGAPAAATPSGSSVPAAPSSWEPPPRGEVVGSNRVTNVGTNTWIPFEEYGCDPRHVNVTAYVKTGRVKSDSIAVKRIRLEFTGNREAASGAMYVGDFQVMPDGWEIGQNWNSMALPPFTTNYTVNRTVKPGALIKAFAISKNYDEAGICADGFPNGGSIVWQIYPR